MKLKHIAAVISLLLALTACMTRYYDKFGGFPLGSDTFTIPRDGFDIKLLVAYRFPYQKGFYDSTHLNITVRIALPKEDLRHVNFERLVLVSADSSYLFTYNRPAVYDKHGKSPIRSFIATEGFTDARSAATDRMSIFTVSRSTLEYNLFLHYTVLHKNGTSESLVKSFPVNISGVKNKARK